jgi:hypothetical protein
MSGNSIDTKDGDESDDSMSIKPAKKKKVQVTNFFDKVPGPSEVEKKPAARKTVPPSKPVAKKAAKKVVASDDDDDADDIVVRGKSAVPARNAPQRTARATAKKYIDLDDESDENASESMFLDDEDQ